MDSLAERVSDEIQADLQKKKELQEKIEEAKRSGDDDEAERLLALLQDADKELQRKIDEEASD